MVPGDRSCEISVTFARRILRRWAVCLLVPLAAAAAEPPRFEVPGVQADAPLSFVVYGDTRFTSRPQVANAQAREALVAKIAAEHPAAILIGGDLVYAGDDADDYGVYRSETAAWSQQHIPVFPVLGNHEYSGCAPQDRDPCLEKWWQAVKPLDLKPFRWYAVTLGPRVLAVMLDSGSSLKPKSEQYQWFEQEMTSAGPQVQFILVVLHFPPVRDPIFPRGRDEREIARWLAKHARSLPARVVVIGSHVHNYERYYRDGVSYLVSGGGGAKPVPDPRLFGGELSQVKTAVNFHYLRFHLENGLLSGTMVRFDTDARATDPWSEPDRFEVSARQ